jgi:hypothetical protein
MTKLFTIKYDVIQDFHLNGIEFSQKQVIYYYFHHWIIMGDQEGGGGGGEIKC